MDMLPKIRKLQKKYNELKVERTNKDATIQIIGNKLQKLKVDLFNLQSANDELSTATSINMQKLNYELPHEEKERVEKKFEDSTAVIKNL